MWTSAFTARFSVVPAASAMRCSFSSVYSVCRSTEEPYQT
jgi:hypothetical protein